MKQIIRFGMLSVAMALGIAGNAVPAGAVGETVKHLVIAEVPPESSDSASDEYVELFNPNAADIDVSGWRLQYRSYSHTKSDAGSWATKAIVGCQSAKAGDCTAPQIVTIGAGDTLRLSSYETGDGIVALTSGMATTGGEVRLIQPGTNGASDIVQDLVGYGNAEGYEGAAPASAPKAGQSIVRAQDGQGAYVDTDQNGSDFALTPDETVNPPLGSGVTTGEDNAGQQPGMGAGNPPASYLEADVTEVFPDPASPQTDSADEFIELYNPYDQEIDLTGYVLKTGTDWSHVYAIGDVTISSYGYVALTSAKTHLSLSNSGSGVQLYDPSGKLLVEVPSYDKAKSGDSWIRDANGQWVWTTHPTPGDQNILELPLNVQTAKATAVKSAAKATSSPKKAATTKKSASGVVKELTSSAAQSAQIPGSTGNPAGMWVLAGAGVLGAGYALFEYRQDISDFVRRRWQAFVTFVRRH